MSVKTFTVNSPDDSNDAINNVTSQPLGTNNFNAGNSKALTLMEVLQSYQSSSRLTGEARSYIDALNKLFADNGANITCLPVSNDYVEGRVFIDEASKKAFILIFSETNLATDNTSPSAYANALIDNVIATNGSVSVLQTIVVAPCDYPLVGNMATFILNGFKCVKDGSMLTADMFRGVRLSVITNIEQVRQFVRQRSPHAVPQRDDIGVLLCYDVRNDNNFNNKHEMRQVPILAITGYTQIKTEREFGSHGNKYIPIATITDIISAVPNSNLLAAALPIAADAFIRQGGWIRPYTTYRNGAPNLGSLLQDAETKKPLFVDNEQNLNALCDTCLYKPFLAIDITEGRARPINIDHLAFANSEQPAIDSINSFFGENARVIDANDVMGNGSGALDNKTVIARYANLTGTYIDKGTVKDTRCVDYLDLATKSSDQRALAFWLVQPLDMYSRIGMVAQIFPEHTVPLYHTTTVVLNAAAINRMTDLLNQFGIVPQYDTPTNGNYNISNILTAVNANNFNTGVNNGYIGSNFAGMNPYYRF